MRPNKDKPKKKKVDMTKVGISDAHYNEAIDDYEKFLPSEEEIAKLMWEQNQKFPRMILTMTEALVLAKAISKRIGVNK